MKTLVATGFYSELSKSSSKTPTNGRGNTACKYIEFFELWYKYTRRAFPNEDLLILDNGSPIPLLSQQKYISEDIYKIKADNRTSPETKLNTFRLKGRLPHHEGWCRQLLTILDIANINKYDTLFYIESDALIAFNPHKYQKYTFVSKGPWGLDGRGVQQCFMKIDKCRFSVIPHLKKIYRKIQNPNLQTERGEKDCYLYTENFAEVGFKNLMFKDNSTFLSKEDSEAFLHDANQQDLELFLQNYGLTKELLK